MDKIQTEVPAGDPKALRRAAGFWTLIILVLVTNVIYSIRLFRKRQVFKGILLLLVILPVSLLMSMALFFRGGD